MPIGRKPKLRIYYTPNTEEAGILLDKESAETIGSYIRKSQKRFEYIADSCCISERSLRRMVTPPYATKVRYVLRVLEFLGIKGAVLSEKE